MQHLSETQHDERQMREIIEHLPLGVFVVEIPSGRVQFANAETATLLGHAAVSDESLWTHSGRHGPIHEDGTRLKPEEFALYQAMQEQRRIGPRVQLFRRIDGSTAWFEITAAPIGDSRSVRKLAVVAIQNVTARQQVEQEARQAAALRDSEARFRLITEQAPVMLWMGDEQGRCLYLNKALREFWGASEDLSEFDWSTKVLPEDRATLFVPFEAAMRAHRSFSVEARFWRVDGQARIVHTEAHPRFGDKGEFLGMIGVNVDVTDARQAQNDLMHINELLEERVAAALAEKAQAEAALIHAQRLEAMGRLTGGVAHDFNNLLTAVIGALDLMLRNPEDAERRARLGEAALAAARRGERLTAQLLAFARRQALRPELCDLNALIRESEPLLRRAMGDGVSFEMRLCDTPTVVRIDPAQFEASLLNLIGNAVDAIPAEGWITLETSLRAVAEGRLPGLSAGRYFTLCLSDTGLGMSEEVMARIFEPFFTTKPPGKGTGLGLSQVYGFVRQSGGEVTVDSVEGQGTTFTVYLPVAGQCGTELPAAAPVDEKGQRELRVLLVEDDRTVATVTEMMLKSLGHEVRRVDDANGALQVLSSGAPVDLLLSDVVMPGGMNGVELARAAANLRPDMKVLLCSGYAGEAVDQVLAGVPWPLLKKPYMVEDLAVQLARLDAGAVADSMPGVPAADVSEPCPTASAAAGE